MATNPRDTGGGGISWYEGHSARKPGASGTGSSAANVVTIRVPEFGELINTAVVVS